jgi:hypothetical protein
MIHALLLVASVFSIGTESAPMEFTTLARGATSQIEAPRTVVVRTATEWAVLWKQHAGDGKPPAVQFTRSMVIGVFAGTRPTAGYAVEISQIETRDGGLLVTYRERQPGPDDMVTQALTAPFHIVRTDLHRGEVTFQRLR